MANAVAPDPSANGTREAARAHPQLTDQEEFDAGVARNSKLGLAWLGAVGIVAALVMSAIALMHNGGPRMMGLPAAVSPGVVAPVTAAPTITLSVAGANKLGPDGRMHDSFSKTDFAVKAGQPTVLRIANADDVPHSITSVAAGVSATVLPGTHDYTLLATRAGRFEWVCVIPCDAAAHGWAMTHPGYMAGFITAT